MPGAGSGRRSAVAPSAWIENVAISLKSCYYEKRYFSGTPPRPEVIRSLESEARDAVDVFIGSFKLQSGCNDLPLPRPDDETPQRFGAARQWNAGTRPFGAGRSQDSGGWTIWRPGTWFDFRPASAGCFAVEEIPAVWLGDHCALRRLSVGGKPMFGGQ